MLRSLRVKVDFILGRSLTPGAWQADEAQQAQRADTLGTEIQGIQTELTQQLAQQQAANDATRLRRYNQLLSPVQLLILKPRHSKLACAHDS